VVLAAFSIGERFPHGTLPSSLNAVTAFLLGCGALVEVPKPVCVAYNRTARSGRIVDGRDKSGAARVSEIIVIDCVVDYLYKLAVCLFQVSDRVNTLIPVRGATFSSEASNVGKLRFSH
jgi:hypothetical protein